MEKSVLVIDCEIKFFIFINSNLGCLHADIYECAINNGGCSQVCLNTEGSYIFNCYPGYEFGSNDHTCNGIGVLQLQTDYTCTNKHNLTLIPTIFYAGISTETENSNSSTSK